MGLRQPHDHQLTTPWVTVQVVQQGAGLLHGHPGAVGGQGEQLVDPERKELADLLAGPGARLLLEPVAATTPLVPHVFVETIAARIEAASEDTACRHTSAVLGALAAIAGNRSPGPGSQVGCRGVSRCQKAAE
jgi:hypothetical protein